MPDETTDQRTAELPVAFRLSPDEHDAFRRACAAVERSMSGQLRVLVRDWLRGREDLEPSEDLAA